MSDDVSERTGRSAVPEPSRSWALLVTTCHPVPTVAVTAFVVALGIAVDLSPLRLGAVALATFAGQLSIGWSNDLIDAGRDALSERSDKPLRTGRGRRTVAIATSIALAVCILVSLLVGPLAAACHLVGVACGWAYNLGVKATPWSWAPYALAFGLLPSWVIAAEPDAGLAPGWMTLAAALLGVSAHLANAAPDVHDDRANGIHGLPQRLGGRRSMAVAGVLLCLAAAVGLLGPQGVPTTSEVVTLVALVAATAVLTIALLRSAGGPEVDPRVPRWSFPVLLGLVAVVVAVVLLAA